MDRCHVCGNPTTEEKAYARIALSDRVYLICCPMCLTAIQAGAVQRRMVAKSHEAPRASVFVEYLPAGQVGGDYAWVHAVGRDLMYAVVVDVSGHGITSSLVASRIAPEIERLARGRQPLAEFAEALNQLMWSTFSEERVYLTLFAALLDFEEREVRYVNCGHPPGLLWSERYRSFAQLQPEDFPVGLFEAKTFGIPRTKAMAFEIGDRLVLYTDGVLGLRQADGSELGEAGLHETMRAAMGRPLEESTRNLFADLSAKHEARPEDDLLVVVLDLHGGASAPQVQPVEPISTP
jgi:sigma-B regulation protein RsbU (phosphoserine phosphatase)